jgi:hypothetical protein
MLRYRLTRPYFDGLELHKTGTVLELEEAFAPSSAVLADAVPAAPAKKKPQPTALKDLMPAALDQDADTFSGMNKGA